MQPRDPEIGDVDRADLVKGYEYDKDQYVILTDEDFEKVRIESSEALTIDYFADESDVDELYLEQPYYLAPEGKVAEETFRVIQQAMQKKGKVALSRLVIGRRERLVMLYPRDKGFVVTTLRTADEVRTPQTYFSDISEGEVDQEMLTLASQLIDQKTSKFDPKGFIDHYEEALRGVVKAKLQGQEPVTAKAPERGKVINLMDALKRSLQRPETGAGAGAASAAGAAAATPAAPEPPERAPRTPARRSTKGTGKASAREKKSA